MGLVAICLCIVASACNSRNDMNYSTRTKFPWVPNISAPRNYPVEIKYAYLCYGTEGDLLVTLWFTSIKVQKIFHSYNFSNNFLISNSYYGN